MKFFPEKFNALFVRWFGCGYFPKAPGTAGSVGALPLCWAAMNFLDPLTAGITALGFTAIAILATAQDQLTSKERDPSYVVIDEVAGMLWACWAIPYSPLMLALAFGLFRIFDVVKPFPANWFDRRSKTSETAIGRGAYIVLDDVAAGLYVCLILKAVLHYGLFGIH